MYKLYFSSFILVFLISCSVNAQLLNLENDNWTEIGNVALTYVTTDADNTDGLNDGALRVNGLSSVDGQGAEYSFDGTLEVGKNLAIKSYVYNVNNSYVALKLELYNKTDATVLVSSASTSILTGDVKIFEIDYTSISSDSGDQLQLRYIRTDGGNTARDFIIDNASLNGDFLGGTTTSEASCSVSYTADIPLTTATTTQVNEINQIYQTFSDLYLGESLSAIGGEQSFLNLFNQAKTDYDDLNIVVSGNSISGGDGITSMQDPSKILLRFAQYIKFYPTASDVDDIKEKAENVVWLISQKFCDGTIGRDYNAYGFKNFAIPTMFLGEYLSTKTKELFGNVLKTHSENFKFLWEFTPGDGYNVDWIYNISGALTLYATWLDTDDEKVRWMKGMTRYLERFLVYSQALDDGIKVDGTGFHHWAAYDGYMYGLSSAVDMVYCFDQTSYQINESSYKTLRKKIYLQGIISNDKRVKGISDSGRNPHIRFVTNNSTTTKKLAIAGGNILGLETADPILAGYYNRVWGADTELNYTIATPFEEGFVQSNYAHRGVYRKDNWLAHFKGFSSYMWGAELYTTTNRYGRYQSYGVMEIINPGDLSAEKNGYDVGTWNWNHYPGTTSIELPWDKLHGEKGRSDELQQKRFAGSLTLKNINNEVLDQTFGTYGLFAMDFQEKENQGWSTIISSSESHNDTFTFKKSNFAFSDMIVCLGSGINNDDTQNNTITTLYQRLENSRDVVVNGSVVSSGTNVYTGTNNWVISNANNGFYLVNGGDLNVWSGSEVTPNHKQYPTDNWSGNSVLPNTYGYLNHGKNPSNKGYEYISLPQTTITQMSSLHTEMQTSNRPYVVHQKNENAHIVAHKVDKVWGYALFTANTNINHTGSVIKGNDIPCLAMYQEIDTNKIVLSMSNPDLGYTSRQTSGNSPTVNIQLTLNGYWTISESHPNASVVSSNASQTVIQFATKDGLPIELGLTKDSGTLGTTNNQLNNSMSVYPNPVTSELIIESNHHIVKYSIINLTGKVVKKGFCKNKEAKLKVDISNLAKGGYFVKTHTDNNISNTHKIIIK